MTESSAARRAGRHNRGSVFLFFLQNFFHFPDSVFRQFSKLWVIISCPASRNVGFRHFTMPLFKLTFWLLAVKLIHQFLHSKIRVLAASQVLSSELKSFCNSVIIRIIVFVLQTQKINIPLLVFVFHHTPFQFPGTRYQHRETLLFTQLLGLTASWQNSLSQTDSLEYLLILQIH